MKTIPAKIKIDMIRHFCQFCVLQHYCRHILATFCRLPEAKIILPPWTESEFSNMTIPIKTAGELSNQTILQICFQTRLSLARLKQSFQTRPYSDHMKILAELSNLSIPSAQFANLTFPSNALAHIAKQTIPIVTAQLELELQRTTLKKIY